MNFFLVILFFIQTNISHATILDKIIKCADTFNTPNGSTTSHLLDPEIDSDVSEIGEIKEPLIDLNPPPPIHASHAVMGIKSFSTQQRRPLPHQNRYNGDLRWSKNDLSIRGVKIAKYYFNGLQNAFFDELQEKFLNGFVMAHHPNFSRKVVEKLQGSVRVFPLSPDRPENILKRVSFFDFFDDPLGLYHLFTFDIEDVFVVARRSKSKSKIEHETLTHMGLKGSDTFYIQFLLKDSEQDAYAILEPNPISHQLISFQMTLFLPIHKGQNKKEIKYVRYTYINGQIAHRKSRGENVPLIEEMSETDLKRYFKKRFKSQ